MKYFKITKTWTVKVKDEESEEVAIKLVASNPEKYLDSSTVTRTEYKNHKQTWGNVVKEQLLGSNGKR